MLFHKLISTCFGIGYISKGGGSVAAAACCICWYFLLAKGYNPVPLLLITSAITLLGIWSAGRVATIWGHDPSKVVIDEAAGMCISLLFVPVKVIYILTAFVLFRFFDIVKPLFIKRTEQLPGGWGIMLDDVVAGVYTNILLQAVLWFKLF
ncbi:MAG: phosphatidylglycerophosphatase A [Mucilaginibacter sp.]